MAVRAGHAPLRGDGRPARALRAGVLTDNGHPHRSTCAACPSPTRWRSRREINQWPGVVSVGIFARHRASVCLLGTAAGVQTLTYERAD